MKFIVDGYELDTEEKYLDGNVVVEFRVKDGRNIYCVEDVWNEIPTGDVDVAAWLGRLERVVATEPLAQVVGEVGKIYWFSDVKGDKNKLSTLMNVNMNLVFKYFDVDGSSWKYITEVEVDELGGV